MTVSFFLKRSKNDKGKGIRDALTYGLSIIVIYLGLGLLVTAFFGSDALNAMSTNAVFNILFFLMLVVFGYTLYTGRFIRNKNMYNRNLVMLRRKWWCRRRRWKRPTSRMRVSASLST